MPHVDERLEKLPEPGEVFMGKYRILRLVGMGGMGAVIEAEHLHLGERVAIKFLLADGAKRPDRVERFSREAWAAAKIKSDHVTRVMDVGTAPTGDFYMVMEFLEGEDLLRILRRGPLPISKSVDFLLQAGEALSEAHRLGIVHRDLKPANLFVTRRPDGSDHIKVLDFGISKFAASSSNLTKTSALMGSPLYMAPEQLTSTKSADTRADIWALGVLLFEMITDDLPFLGESLPEICTKVLYEPPRRLRELLPGAPAALEKVILRCLEKERERRYSDLCELSIALAPFGGESAQRSLAYVRGVLRPNVADTRPRLHSWIGEDGPTAVRMIDDSTTSEPITARTPPRGAPDPRPSDSEAHSSHPEAVSHPGGPSAPGLSSPAGSWPGGSSAEPSTARLDAYTGSDAPTDSGAYSAVAPSQPHAQVAAALAAQSVGAGTVTAEPVWRPQRPNHATKGVVAVAVACLLLGGAAAVWVGLGADATSPEASAPEPAAVSPAARTDGETEDADDGNDRHPESAGDADDGADRTGAETADEGEADEGADPAETASAGPTSAPPPPRVRYSRPPKPKPSSILDKQF